MCYILSICLRIIVEVCPQSYIPNDSEKYFRKSLLCCTFMKLQLPFLLVPLEYLLHKENIEKNFVLMNAIFHFKLLEVYLFFIPSLLLLPSGRCD